MKFLITTLLLLGTFTAMADGDAKRGAMLYAAKTPAALKAVKMKSLNCVQCHKKDGMGAAKKKDGKYKLSAMKGPRIAGLDEKYIYEQLVAIQNKTRKTKYTNTMKMRLKKKYKKQELMDLAAYVSKVINPSAGSYTSEIWPRK